VDRTCSILKSADAPFSRIVRIEPESKQDGCGGPAPQRFIVLILATMKPPGPDINRPGAQPLWEASGRNDDA
jgi:hypothetical protein